MADIQLRDQYDWAVLGDDLGALLSAGLAARLGLSVLILPVGSAGASQGLRISRSGQCVDLESNFVPGLGRMGAQSGLVAECLNVLGALPSELQLLRDSGHPQVVTPEARVALLSDLEGFRAELLRELGPGGEKQVGWSEVLAQASEEIFKHWRELPERLTLREGAPKKDRVSAVSPASFRKSLSRRYKGESLAAPADAVASGLLFGATSFPREAPERGEFLHALALGRIGASVQGGQSALRDLLLRIARRNGADAPLKTECKRVFVEKGRLTGVQTSQHGKVIQVNGAALGCGVERAAELLSESGKAWFKRLKSPPAPAGWKFTIALTVHEEAIAHGAGQRLIWKEAGAPAIEIETVAPSDYGLREQGKKLVFLRTLMPYSQESLGAGYQSQVAARMVRKATELFPFLEFHILRIFPDFREAGTELGDVYGFPVPQLIPGNLRCYSSVDGIGSESGIDGLFVTNAESYPELGGMGGAVAAIEAVAWLAHRSGLPGPFA